MIHLEYYRVFYMVAKVGRITDAAKLLSISQPAVSQTIGQMEKQLGCKLFTRSKSGVKLTGEGELLYHYVQKGYEAFEQGEKELLKMQNLEVGEVRIGASDMTLQFYLLPYLERFHEKYPDIKVTVTNGPTPETIERLLTGSLDFGVVSTPFMENERILAHKVRKIQDTFVCGRRFLPYKNKTLDFSVLQELPIISLEHGTSSRSYMDRFLAEQKVVLEPEFELATSDMIVAFALRNLGVGMVMRDFAEEAIESGKLFELRFNKLIPSREFCLIQDKGASLTPAASKLLELLGESVE